MDADLQDAFLFFFRGLARHAPGDDELTLQALRSCELPENPVIYDLGAGTGSSTLVLAEELESPIVAVDLLDQSLKAIQTRAERRGIDQWVETQARDFMDLDVPNASIDLIWSEGAIYAVGWEEALPYWRTALKDSGYMVISDCVWTTDERDAEAVEFWETEYPTMNTAQGLKKVAEANGFEVVDTLHLPASAWETYYGPLEQRLGLVLENHTSGPRYEVALELRREIDIWRRHGASYGYVFFVLRPR